MWRVGAALWCSALASDCGGSSCCRALKLWRTALRHVRASPTRDRTCLSGRTQPLHRQGSPPSLFGYHPFYLYYHDCSSIQICFSGPGMADGANNTTFFSPFIKMIYIWGKCGSSFLSLFVYFESRVILLQKHSQASFICNCIGRKRIMEILMKTPTH